ncbi:hypothetical protein FQN54_004643 [Arachnomyces sp. PD_36]|nr:hypothetical protein FQN54_004643 [Arachnomyces sp. PD_36]
MISSSLRWKLARLRLGSLAPRSTRSYHLRPCSSTWHTRRQTLPANRLQRLAPARRLHSPSENVQESKIQHLATNYLPVSCPGCGALTQWVDTNEPGFYSTSRRSVKSFLQRAAPWPASEASNVESGPQVGEDQAVTTTEPAEGVEKKDEGVASEVEETAEELQPPFCDRCHNLINHRNAASVHNPSIQSIRDIMSDSPFKHNHVYHVLDAADFPLSLIPNIYRDLALQFQRTKNRRSRSGDFGSGGRRTAIHFVITRSDLLAPMKEQVDSLMAPIIEILRDALSTGGRNIRMGNVHLVSAHRGWWTKDVKQKIWEHGGAVWLVGKTNVGKSNLIEAIFPKPTITPDSSHGGGKTVKEYGKQLLAHTRPRESEAMMKDDTFDTEIDSNPDSLLPPVQRETRFPVLPIVSPLAGTTASPIRIPFGGRRGELIDLPGLSRGGIEEFAQEGHEQDLIMRKRIKPERIVVKPGKSLLLGGLVRITPVNPQDVLLAASFTSIQPHLTSTEKAVGMQIQERVANIPTIAKDDIGHTISSAGVFELGWNVTQIYGKKQPKPGRRRDREIPWSPFELPYKVMATDILIEGCGWVELSMQVRKRGFEERGCPEVEIFSPGGKYIGTRMPLNCWAFLSGDKPRPLQKPQKEPAMKQKQHHRRR